MRPRLKETCQVPWNTMVPGKNGRYCHSCSKTVQDFTSMSNEEILEHISGSAEQVCGRFHLYQLEPEGSRFQRLIISIQEKLAGAYPRMRLTRWGLALLGVVLLASGCRIRRPYGYLRSDGYTVRYMDSIRHPGTPSPAATDYDKKILEKKLPDPGNQPHRRDSI